MSSPDFITILENCRDDQSRGQAAIAARVQFKKISFDDLVRICNTFQSLQWKILILEQYHHILRPSITPEDLSKFLSSIAPLYHNSIRELLKDKQVSLFENFMPEDDVILTIPDFSHLSSPQNVEKSTPMLQNGISCRKYLVFSMVVVILVIYLLIRRY